MSDNVASILALKTHRDNLEAANSFDEYKAAHLEYVNFLIKYYKGKEAMYTAMEEFTIKTETLIQTAIKERSHD